MTTINILHLYPKEMNLYGDHGNVVALQKRCEWRGISTKVIHHELGDKLPEKIDIIFGGGGQDSGQSKIERDLQIIAPKLKRMIDSGTPALVVCGLYQLFGNYFETKATWRAAIAEHTAIVDAIAAHDAEGARAAMHAHMDKSHTRFSASWRRAKAI